VLVIYAIGHRHSGKSGAPPASTSSSSLAFGSNPALSRVSGGVGVDPTPTPTDPIVVSSPSDSSSEQFSAHSPTDKSTPDASTPQTSTAATTAASGGGIKSLTIAKFVPDSKGSYKYVAHVNVVTEGKKPVTVTVSIAGTLVLTSPGVVGTQTQSYPLSGDTSYEVEAEFDVHSVCPAPYIDVVASAPGAGSTVQYTSSPCAG